MRCEGTSFPIRSRKIAWPKGQPTKNHHEISVIYFEFFCCCCKSSRNSVFKTKCREYVNDFPFLFVVAGRRAGIRYFFSIGQRENEFRKKKIAMDSIEIDMLGSFGVQTHKKKQMKKIPKNHSRLQNNDDEITDSPPTVPRSLFV